MIALVIPTIRPKNYGIFKKLWKHYLNGIQLIVIEDGKEPLVNGISVKGVMGEYSDLIYNFNSGVRNLGFAYISRYLKDIDTIISLDDDVEPCGDTIKDHINALNMKVPITWMSTASRFTRGFPYRAREEAEVVLSHGGWRGVIDWDAPTQLVQGNIPVKMYKGVIPKGCLFPFCSMNFAFKRKLLPYIYQAPMYGDINRFEDIWGGVEIKKDIDRKNWAAVTGYATVYHKRASNVWTNLIKEARGLKMNEEYGKDPYFNLFHEKRERWKEFIHKYEKS